MGLDSYLFRRGKTPKGKIVENLDREKNEVGYWRKQYEIHSLFCRKLNGGEDNCVDVVLSLEELKEILEMIDEEDTYTKEVLLRAINDTDFEHEEIFYYAWY